MLVRCALIVPAILLTAGPVHAQTSSPSESAKKFNLDPSVLHGDDRASASASSTEGPPETLTDKAAVAAEQPPAPEPVAADPAAPLTLDTPIAALIADPRGKAVLDRDLPGLSTDENLDKFSAKSLREFQPLTGGQLTNAMLAKVAFDLANPGAPSRAPGRQSAARGRGGR